MFEFLHWGVIKGKMSDDGVSVKLKYESLGKSGNPPLVIMHGLLGSSRNWMSVGDLLSEYFDVFVLDLRNHGGSPHRDSMSYEEMAQDLVEWLEDRGIDKFYLLGHSLGGKVAMTYACRYPGHLLGLIIEDIAPREYVLLRYRVEFDAMNGLDLAHVKTRGEADELLKVQITDWEWRQFILTNLVRDANKHFHWRINLKALTAWLPEIMKNPLKESDRYDGPTLFLRGADSDYIREEDYGAIYKHFPHARIDVIEHAGHNAHIDNTEEFVQAVAGVREG